MRRSACWLALVFGLLGGAAAAETITIGAEDDWLPYSGRIGGEAQGISVDIARAAFAISGIEVRFEVLPYARCLLLTRSGALPACFNTLRNEAIAPHYLWHRPALFQVHYKIYALAESTQSGLLPKDLEGKRVAVTNAYEYGPEIDANPRIRRVLSLRDENNFRMLLRDRADYTVAPAFNTERLLARHPDLAGRFKIVGQVPPADVHMVFSRRHPQAERLKDVFERGLRELHANGRVKAIEADWLQRLR